MPGATSRSPAMFVYIHRLLPAGGSGIDVLIARANIFGAVVRVLRVILGAFPEFSLGSASRVLLAFPCMRWVSFGIVLLYFGLVLG